MGVRNILCVTECEVRRFGFSNNFYLYLLGLPFSIPFCGQTCNNGLGMDRYYRLLAGSGRQKLLSVNDSNVTPMHVEVGFRYHKIDPYFKQCGNSTGRLSITFWTHARRHINMVTSQPRGVSNDLQHDGLLSPLSKLWSKETSKSALLALSERNPPVTGGFPSQSASNAENVSMPWRHAPCISPSWASRETSRASILEKMDAL